MKNKIKYESDNLQILENSDNQELAVLQKTKVILLPFEIGINGNIKRIYVKNGLLPIENTQTFSSLYTLIDESEEDFYKIVKELVKDRLGIPDSVLTSLLSPNIIYLLGKMNQSVPIHGSTIVYAIDVTSIRTSDSGISIPDETYDKHKTGPIDFTMILKGKVEDSDLLSASMLLLSHLS